MDSVIVVDENQRWFVRAALGFFEVAIGGDDDFISAVDEACGGAVQADFAGFAGDHVRGEARAIVAVVDFYALKGDESGRFI